MGLGDPGAVLDIPGGEEKFALFANLGTIVVPDNYIQETCLKSFREELRDKFHCLNPDLIDGNFQNPTRILKPGDEFRALVFRQTVAGVTTSKERLTFLKGQNAVLVGAQGAALAFRQKRDQLPEGYWYSLFDESERLYKTTSGVITVPELGKFKAGGFYFVLTEFGGDWRDYHHLLGFFEL